MLTNIGEFLLFVNKLLSTGTLNNLIKILTIGVITNRLNNI